MEDEESRAKLKELCHL